ncbi:hypothetical protein BST61_g1432 [Cercospora zeina]
MGNTNDDYQQVLLAALFGVLTTVLAVASVIVAYLQLRRHRLAHAVADVERDIDAISLAGMQEVQAHATAANHSQFERDADLCAWPAFTEHDQTYGKLMLI